MLPREWDTNKMPYLKCRTSSTQKLLSLRLFSELQLSASQTDSMWAETPNWDEFLPSFFSIAYDLQKPYKLYVAFLYLIFPKYNKNYRCKPSGCKLCWQYNIVYTIVHAHQVGYETEIPIYKERHREGNLFQIHPKAKNWNYTSWKYSSILTPRSLFFSKWILQLLNIPASNCITTSAINHIYRVLNLLGNLVADFNLEGRDQIKIPTTLCAALFCVFLFFVGRNCQIAFDFLFWHVIWHINKLETLCCLKSWSHFPQIYLEALSEKEIGDSCSLTKCC